MKRRRCGPLSGRRLVQPTTNSTVCFERKHHMQPWRVIGVEMSPRAVNVDEEYLAEVRSLTVKKFDAGRVKKTTSHLQDMRGLKEFPQLGLFFSDTVLEGEDGKVDREAGGIWIQPRNGVFRVVLKEPTQALMMVLEVKSFAALWTVVETALGAEGSMWEVDQFAQAKRKPKKK